MQHIEVTATRLPPCVVVSFEHMPLPHSANLPPQVACKSVQSIEFGLHQARLAHQELEQAIKFCLNPESEVPKIFGFSLCITTEYRPYLLRYTLHVKER